MRRILSLIAIIMIAIMDGIFAPSAQAQQLYQFYQGIREMSMGGASIAVVDDETALMLNPAGLGKIRDATLNIANPEVEADNTAPTVVGYNPLVGNNPQDLLNDLNQHPNTPFHELAQVFPSFVTPNFGIGVLGKYQTDAEVDSTTNKYLLNYRNDYALVLGYDFKFFDGIVKLGVNGRLIDRTEINNQSLPTNSTNLTLSGLSTNGYGIGTDTGLIITAPWAWLPTVSAVYRDMGNTSFNGPATVPQTVDVAMAVFPILSNTVRSSWTVEYRDALTWYQEQSQVRRLHAGAEINMMDIFYLRGGYNEGYWTAGLELSIGNYQFQLGSYGEEIGTYPTTVEDRRYMFQFAIRF